MKYRSSATAALTVRSVSISPMAADPRNYLNAVFSGPCDRCTALRYTRMRWLAAELMNYDPPDPSSKLQICTHRCIIERRRRRYLSPSLGGGGDFHDSGQMIVIIFPSQSIRPFAQSARLSQMSATFTSSAILGSGGISRQCAARRRWTPLPLVNPDEKVPLSNPRSLMNAKIINTGRE